MTSGELAKLAKVFVFSAGSTYIGVSEFGNVVKVEGISMQPTFNPNCRPSNEDLGDLFDSGLSREVLRKELKARSQKDLVLLNKWAARNKNRLRSGDVVSLISPRNPRELLIKRITAMPGDAIYLRETGETRIIEEGHCWIEGDNQSFSTDDSNNFGPVPLGLIKAKISYILWPPHRLQPIKCDPNMCMKSSKTALISQKRITPATHKHHPIDR